MCVACVLCGAVPLFNCTKWPINALAPTHNGVTHFWLKDCVHVLAEQTPIMLCKRWFLFHFESWWKIEENTTALQMLRESDKSYADFWWIAGFSLFRHISWQHFIIPRAWSVYAIIYRCRFLLFFSLYSFFCNENCAYSFKHDNQNRTELTEPNCIA